MPRTDTVRVQRQPQQNGSDGRRVAIPKALAEGMGIQPGDEVRWSVKDDSTLELDVEQNSNGDD